MECYPAKKEPLERADSAPMTLKNYTKGQDDIYDTFVKIINFADRGANSKEEIPARS